MGGERASKTLVRLAGRICAMYGRSLDIPDKPGECVCPKCEDQRRKQAAGRNRTAASCKNRQGSLPTAGLEAQTIIDRYRQFLLGPKIPLRGLDRGVTEQELDLLEIAAVLAAERGAGEA
jgi:hypothetical protein